METTAELGDRDIFQIKRYVSNMHGTVIFLLLSGIRNWVYWNKNTFR